MSYYNMHNIIKGFSLENLVNTELKKLGFTSYNHNVSQPGVDYKGYRNGVSVVAECLCWTDGNYLNLRRLDSIIRNLTAYPKAVRLLIMTGVSITPEQRRQLEACDIIPCELENLSKEAFIKEVSVLLTTTFYLLLDSTQSAYDLDLYPVGLRTVVDLGQQGFRMRLTIGNSTHATGNQSENIDTVNNLSD